MVVTRNPSQASTAPSQADHDALLSASHAYRGSSPLPRSPSASSIASVGALAAAAKVGNGEKEALVSSPVDFRPVQKRAGTNEHKRSATMEPANTMLLQSPAQQRPPTSRSPSQTAAILAAARAKPQDTPRKPAIAPKPRRLSSHNRTRSTQSINTDASSIAPTTSLVNLFEKRSATTPLQPVVTKSPITIQSPKPLRSNGLGSVLQAEMGAVQAPSQSRQGRKPDTNNRQEKVVEVLEKPQAGQRSSLDSIQNQGDRGNTASTQNSSSGRQGGQIHKVGDTTQTRSSRQEDDRDLSLRPSTSKKDSISPSPRLGPSPNNLTDSDTVLTPIPPIPLSRTVTAPVDIKRASRSTDTAASSPSSKSVNAAYRQLYPSRKTPLTKDNDLANAIVASSLASTRNPPTKREPPAPPLTRRQTHHTHSIFHSRTPSPTKIGLRQTMRKHDSTDSDEEDHPYSKHQKKRHFRKHPNKHHEGDRKRWRDAVTDGERRRYEGVWAANKGLYLPDKNEPPDGRIDVESYSDQVSNVITKDIWARSRLPDFELEAVWDLVDIGETGRLTKEEFVVGMWLIDQRLKGRKLPVKVQPTVWQSVKGLHGIKVRKK